MGNFYYIFLKMDIRSEWKQRYLDIDFVPQLRPAGSSASSISNMKFIFFILSGTPDRRGTKANLIMTVFQSPIKV